MTKKTKHEGILIVGTGQLVDLLIMEIAARKYCNWRILGLVTEHPGAKTVQGCPVLGTVAALPEIINNLKPDRIVVSLASGGADVFEHQLLEAKVSKNISMELAETVYETLTGKLPIESLSTEEMIFANDFQPSRLTLAATRTLSLVAAIAGLLLTAPVMLVIAVLVRMDSPGPILFRQKRVGVGGKPFRLLKFRSMHPTEQRTSEWAGDNEHRVTRVGRWLRKYRLDELPQLINVIRNDMNLVGPRPHPASNFEMFVLVSRNMHECGVQIPYYSLRTRVKPGITGWAQVRYRYANDLNEEIEKLRFDLYYLKHYSLWLDIRILLETFKVVFFGHRLPECHDAADNSTGGVADKGEAAPVGQRQVEKYAD